MRTDSQNKFQPDNDRIMEEEAESFSAQPKPAQHAAPADQSGAPQAADQVINGKNSAFKLIGCANKPTEDNENQIRDKSNSEQQQEKRHA